MPHGGAARVALRARSLASRAARGRERTDRPSEETAHAVLDGARPLAAKSDDMMHGQRGASRAQMTDHVGFTSSLSRGRQIGHWRRSDRLLRSSHGGVASRPLERNVENCTAVLRDTPRRHSVRANGPRPLNARDRRQNSDESHIRTCASSAPSGRHHPRSALRPLRICRRKATRGRSSGWAPRQ